MSQYLVLVQSTRKTLVTGTVDGIQADYNNGGFAANTNQTTIGMVGVAASDGDPDSGCYMGHGSSEGHFEGWYDSGGGSADCQGYTTWVR